MRFWIVDNGDIPTDVVIGASTLHAGIKSEYETQTSSTILEAAKQPKEFVTESAPLIARKRLPDLLDVIVTG